MKRRQSKQTKKSTIQQYIWAIPFFVFISIPLHSQPCLARLCQYSPPIDVDTQSETTINLNKVGCKYRDSFTLSDPGAMFIKVPPSNTDFIFILVVSQGSSIYAVNFPPWVWHEEGNLTKPNDCKIHKLEIETAEGDTGSDSLSRSFLEPMQGVVVTNLSRLFYHFLFHTNQNQVDALRFTEDMLSIFDVKNNQTYW